MQNDQTLTEHYKKLLSLEEPWMVSDINLNTDKLKLKIQITTKKGAKLPCPVCGEFSPKEDHRQERTWRHLDTMQFETLINCRIPRVSCSKHGVKSVNAPWAEKHSRFTLLFEKFAVDVLKTAQNTQRAKLFLRLNWNQVNDIKKRAVERGMKRRCEEEIENIGIDEKSFLKGHSYATIMHDVDQGRVLDVVADRTREATEELLNRLSQKQKKHVKAVSMDMWKPFMQATTKALSKAEIVHDKYHITTYLSKAVDSVRKNENKAMLKDGNNSLKGTKYLWLTNADKFKPDTRREFKKLMREELKVGRAWSIKEFFKYFWGYHYQGSATKFFNKWYFWATHSRLKSIIKAAKTIKRHFEGIMAYLKHRITNAAAEGLNSKIQVIKANARGFKNFANYRIAILFHCGKLDLYP